MMNHARGRRTRKEAAPLPLLLSFPIVTRAASTGGGGGDFCQTCAAKRLITERPKLPGIEIIVFKAFGESNSAQCVG